MQVPLFHLCRTKLSHSVGGTPVYYDRKGKERKGVLFPISIPGGGRRRGGKGCWRWWQSWLCSATKTEKQQLIIPTSKELHSLVVPVPVWFFVENSLFFFLRSVKLSGGGTFNSFFALSLSHTAGVSRNRERISDARNRRLVRYGTEKLRAGLQVRWIIESRKYYGKRNEVPSVCRKRKRTVKALSGVQRAGAWIGECLKAGFVFPYCKRVQKSRRERIRNARFPKRDKEWCQLS